MAKYKILQYDDPSLYKKCRPVAKFDKRLATLIDDMAETMHQAEGVGLAAPQVGILRRVVVIDCGEGLVELVNPEIIETSGEQGCLEGCLSFPGEKGYVIRPNYVRLQAYDRNGDLYEYEGEELLARAMLHEIDHLDGLIYKRLITEPPEGYLESLEREEAEAALEAEENASMESESAE